MPQSRDAQYRVVAANLDPATIAEADRIAAALRDEGWPRATRSLVIREALELLREELSAKEPHEIFRYFIERRGKRTTRPRLASRRTAF